METIKKESSNRVIFLDNLRYLFVLFVVLQHSGSAYNGLFFLKWWPVSEGDSSMIVACLLSFIDSFSMPLLFYVAGYFALPSIQNHGIYSFIEGKLKRLGLPWVVCLLTICPVLPLIYHYTRDNMTLTNSYLDLWTILMKKAAQFNVGFFSMNKIMMNDGFYQRYMWFISLLLLFFFIFSIIYKAKKKWFDESCPVDTETPSISATLKLLAAVGLLSFICSMILYSIMFITTRNVDPNAWFTLGNVIQFQLIRLVPYILYFCLGVITYKNNWIERGKFPGHLKTWMISFIILLISYWYLMYGFTHSPAKSKEMFVYGFISFPVQNLLTIVTLGFFASLAIRYWNKPRRIDQSLASASYDIYLSHYIFVILFQLILFTMPGIPPLVKFVIVSTLSISCAYTVSRYLIKPFPKMTVALLFSLLIAMFVVIRP